MIKDLVASTGQAGSEGVGRRKGQLFAKAPLCAGLHERPWSQFSAISEVSVALVPTKKASEIHGPCRLLHGHAREPAQRREKEECAGCMGRMGGCESGQQGRKDTGISCSYNLGQVARKNTPDREENSVYKSSEVEPAGYSGNMEESDVLGDRAGRYRGKLSHGPSEGELSTEGFRAEGPQHERLPLTAL